MYEITASMTNDEDFELAFVLLDENDSEIDITNLDFEFVLTDDDGGQLLSKTSADPEITKDTVTSTVTIVFDNDHFTGLDAGTYHMACRYIDGDGRTKQLFVGDLDLIEGYFT